MRRAVLLGVPDSKRTQYLKHAASQAGLDLSFLNWESWQEDLFSFSQDSLLMKIDPPRWNSCVLDELDILSADYNSQLTRLAQAADTCHIRFFNHPSALMDLLDKAQCKETLFQAGIAVTEAVARTPCRCARLSSAAAKHSPKAVSPGHSLVEDMDQLLEIMKLRGICQVFLKPVHGSGAAGVSAFRCHPRTGRMVLYTCAINHPEKGLINTKRLRCFSGREEILSLCNQLLKTECIIERWHPKAQYQGYPYDLRAVVQEGRLDYLLARLSRGPITNLHLNNRPLNMDMLGLPSSVLNQVEEISIKAAGQYPGLTGAGIDILLERGSLSPRIIEMNGQGDLIYQDIYQENRIYRRQAEFMKQWECKKE